MFEYNILKNAQTLFPDVQVKFKNESTLMKLIGHILFFNKDFMNTYTTTIGNTVYFPSQEFIQKSPVTSSVIFLHENCHIYDSKRLHTIIFSLGYLFPQILILFSLLSFINPLFLFFLFFLLPIPSYFRMKLEKKAYIMGLYAMHKISKRENYKIDLYKQADFAYQQFTGPYYCYMWPFKSIKDDLYFAVQEIEKGNKPVYEKEVFDLIDKLLIK